MLRITGGKFRGRSIPSPSAHFSKEKSMRPTTALLRESIFQQFRAEIPGARFLDGFAGSGIMGLEALSHGATFVLAVEMERRQCRVIHQAFESLDIPSTSAKAIVQDMSTLFRFPCRDEAFDIVFMDPPYNYEHWEELIEHCITHNWIKPNGIFIIEHGSREPDMPGPDWLRKMYGDTSLSIRHLTPQ